MGVCVRLPRSILSVLSAIFLVTIIATDALALRYQPRPKWQVGVGYGIGRGAFTGLAGEEYRNGASPHILLGRMLGEHYMISVN